jgi:hypothetical protein
LTTYAGYFNGTIIGTSFSSPVTLSDQDGSLPVTFTFAGNPAVTYGGTVAFALTKSTGPAASTSYLSNAGNNPGPLGSALVNSLTGTGCPLSVAFNNFAILLYGNP